MRRHVVRIVLAAVLGLSGGAAYLAALHRAPAEDDDFGLVGDFALTERSGRTVTRADLEGKVWVAAFVFTCCAGPCPQVSGTMAELHRDVANDPDVRLVTFTVDPERDTPPVLKQYAERYGADAERWLLFYSLHAARVEIIDDEGRRIGLEELRPASDSDSAHNEQ